MTAPDWEALLDRESDNWDLRRAYSTWLHDEADDPQGARLQAWMVENEKYPYLNAAGCWLWDSMKEWVNAKCHSRLGDDVFCALRGPGTFNARSHWVDYRTRQLAESDLCQALASLGII